MQDAIFIKTGKNTHVRILTPSDKYTITEVIAKEELKRLFEVCFWTGFQYIEVVRLHDNMEFVDENNQNILLPPDIQKTKKRSPKERCISIPPQLREILPLFFDDKKPPTGKVWGENLKRWAKVSGICDNDCKGIIPKMARSSIESWMVSAGLPSSWICSRQGHNAEARISCYRDIPFTDEDKSEILRELSGWKLESDSREEN